MITVISVYTYIVLYIYMRNLVLTLEPLVISAAFPSRCRAGWWWSGAYSKRRPATTAQIECEGRAKRKGVFY